MTQNATDSQADIVWKWSPRNQVWFTNLPSPNDQVRKVQMKVKRNETGLWIENGTVSNLYEVSVEVDGEPIAARHRRFVRVYSFAFPDTVGMASVYLAKHLPSKVGPDSCWESVANAIGEVMGDFSLVVEDEDLWLEYPIGDFYLRVGRNKTTTFIQDGVRLVTDGEVSL